MQRHWEILSVPIVNYERLPRLEPPAGYVYIIQDVDFSNRYKIGRTNHPYRRLNKFEVTLPFETKVVHIFRTNDDKGFEYYLHQRFANHRARGEWFDLDDAQLRTLRTLGRRRNANALPAARNRAETVTNSRYVLFIIIFLIGVSSLLVMNSADNNSFSPQRIVTRTTNRANSSATRSYRLPTATSTQSPTAAVRAGDAFYVRVRTNAHSCASKECHAVVKMAVGTRIVASGFVNGQALGVYKTWIRFRRDGKILYIPKLALSRNRLEANADERLSATATLTDAPPTATPTDTPEPSATPSATSQAMLVETRNNLGANARTCPRTNCDILVTLRPDAEIQALGWVEGEEVYDSTLWIQFEYNGELAYIHSELVEAKQ